MINLPSLAYFDQADENGTCPADFSSLEKLYTVSDLMAPCNASYCTVLHANLTSGLPMAELRHSIEAEANLSYCLQLDQESPFCLASPDSCSVRYDQPLRCRWPAPGHGALLRLPLSEPIFVACVCGVLFLSLLLLLWTVVKCRKDQQTPHPSPEPEIIKDKSMPRSLTIGNQYFSTFDYLNIFIIVEFVALCNFSGYSVV